MNEARHRELLDELRRAHEEAARLCKALGECELSDSDLESRSELLRAWTDASDRAARISEQLRYFDLPSQHCRCRLHVYSERE